MKTTNWTLIKLGWCYKPKKEAQDIHFELLFYLSI